MSEMFDSFSAERDTDHLTELTDEELVNLYENYLDVEQTSSERSELMLERIKLHIEFEITSRINERGSSERTN